jgi:protein-disulfide isomerase
VSKKAWIIFSAVCLVVLGGLVYQSNKDKVNVDNVATSTIQAANASNGNIAEHVYGNPKSKVVMIEYGDLQCPGCGSAYPIITPLTEKYKDQIVFIFRNFPLTQLHPNAMVAAAAAEAAGLQGKYWEMHHKLYENQSAWNTLSTDTRVDFFVEYARSLGLNTATFKTDLNSPAVSQKIAYDQALGRKDNVTGTPTFFVDGKQVTEYVKNGKIVSADTSGANPIWADASAFENLLIIPALKKHAIALPTATPAAAVTASE